MNTKKTQAIGHFKEVFLAFDIDAIEWAADGLLNAGVTTREFLEACMPCIEEVGAKFENGEYFLPHLIIAGEMFKKAGAKFEASETETAAGTPLAQIVLGTPKGDIHNLGKDVFGILAQASGFTVHDLGVDVPPEAFLEKLKETGATILGLSSLLTTTFEAIGDVVRLLEDSDLRARTSVIIGGGATEPSLIEKLKVDAQTRDAYEGIKIIKSFVKNGQEKVAA